MESIKVKTDGQVSEIFVGMDWLSVKKIMPSSGIAIITDNNVSNIYGGHFPDAPVLRIKPGESSKKLEIIEDLALRLIDSGIDRNGFLLGIGGGVVCDITGFLASIYMRGIRCGYVSSTMLSQVDASTGGKNGVNLGSIKNVLGCFKQPEFVICDPAMLLTLPEEEYLSGISELVKTAIIGDTRLFELIENNHESIMKRDRNLLTKLVSMAVKFKASVVTKDEKETGLRRILNFGHTYGHAIELYKSIRHGYAVASGMELATGFSLLKGYINDEDHYRIVHLLRAFKLLNHNYLLPPDQVRQLILHDKKKSGSEIHFVFIKGIGQAFTEVVPIEVVVDYYRQVTRDN